MHSPQFCATLVSPFVYSCEQFCRMSTHRHTGTHSDTGARALATILCNVRSPLCAQLCTILYSVHSVQFMCTWVQTESSHNCVKLFNFCTPRNCTCTCLHLYNLAVPHSIQSWTIVHSTEPTIPILRFDISHSGPTSTTIGQRKH